MSKTKINSDKMLARLRELHPSLIDLSLGRTQRALEALGRPQDRLPPTIHIAGTNGKGSLVAYLNAILIACGKRPHSFISPHLVSFHERIRLAGKDGVQDISEQALIDVLARVEKANNGEPITFFEITMVAAFLAYAEHEADYLILETGLGGRFDATNVIETPELTVITPISMDHMDFLGTSIEEIAFEKAGIMKPHVPCIVGRQEWRALEVLRKVALDLDVPLIVEGEDFRAYEQLGRLIYEGEERLLALPLPRLIGSHQVENAGIALATVLHLSQLSPTQEQLEHSMESVRWPARLQLLENERFEGKAEINRDSEIWLDGGHNLAAAKVLAATMADLEDQSPRPLHLVVGMMKRKDAEEFITVFEGLCEIVFTVPVPNSKQGWQADELADIARENGMRAEDHGDIVSALKASGARAESLGGEPVRILICGSLYLAGHVLELTQ